MERNDAHFSEGLRGGGDGGGDGTSQLNIDGGKMAGRFFKNLEPLFVRPRPFSTLLCSRSDGMKT